MLDERHGHEMLLKIKYFIRRQTTAIARRRQRALKTLPGIMKLFISRLSEMKALCLAGGLINVCPAGVGHDQQLQIFRHTAHKDTNIINIYLTALKHKQYIMIIPDLSSPSFG